MCIFYKSLCSLKYEISTFMYTTRQDATPKNIKISVFKLIL
jgi:hypothetical protein